MLGPMREPGTLRYGQDYAEERTLADGTIVKLRLAQPSDREAFRQGFGHLSSQSRYQRFFTLQSQLTEEMLDYLTQVDGRDHVAIVVGTESLDMKSEHGLGVARFIRLAGEPHVAEAAVTVIDEAQGRGLGKLLLDVLADAARERDIHVFRAEVLRENHAMRAILEEAGAHVARDEGETLVFDAPLDAEGAAESGGEHLLRRLLRAAARAIAAARARE
jgi:GNAT superfamily N-acetyltransferase